MSDAAAPVTSFSQAPDALARDPQLAPLPAERRLRLWPGVVVIALMLSFWAVPGWVAPGTMIHFFGMFWGPMAGFLGVVVWWLTLSRLRWYDRCLGVLAFAAVAGVTSLLCHPSFSFIVLLCYGAPMALTVWVGWLLLTPTLSWPARRVGLLAAFVVGWGWCTLLRVEGFDGMMSVAWHWRWTPSAEELFLAEAAARSSSEPDEAVLTLAPGDWPGFRGAARDGRLTGVRIATDWKQHPPRELWRRRVGPGWSSFAAIGDHLFTQEQRGEEEAVVCYHAATGAERWVHRDTARFSEVVAGPGPRATPTFHEGQLYTLGAAGRLNCLDAATGRVLWTRDVVADSGAKLPPWGLASSPLVAHGVVSIFAGGPDGKSVLGYDARSGELTWSAGDGGHSYCSPQLARLGGVEQVLLATDMGLFAFDPSAGRLLWQHDWSQKGMARVVQPTVLDNGDVLLGTGFQAGTRCLHLTRQGSDWSVKEVWTTQAIRPYFNDLVVYKDHLYGFDSQFFTCVSLDEGQGRWRARGYGSGQVLLLAEQGLLLILSEKGEVVLVEANPQKHTPRGRFQALHGKTWNHPVVAHGRLFVRNGEEMACYELKAE